MAIGSTTIWWTSSGPVNAPERWHIKWAWPMPNECKMATEADPNKKLTNGDILTETIPKESEHDNCAHRMAYSMASQETVRTNTRRWWPSSYSDRYRCRRTSHGGPEDNQGPFRTKPLTETLTGYRVNRIQNSLNSIPNWMANRITRGVTNDCRETNENSTEAAYQDGNREVDPERTEAITQMTITKKRSTETLLNPTSWNGEIGQCNVQSRFPRAAAWSYHGEYDHLLWRLCVGYWSITYCPCLMQLAHSTTLE